MKIKQGSQPEHEQDRNHEGGQLEMAEKIPDEDAGQVSQQMEADNKRENLGPGDHEGHLNKAGENDKLMGGEDLQVEDVEKIQFYVKVQMESDPSNWSLFVANFPFCCILISFLIFAGFLVIFLLGEFYVFDEPHPRDFLIWDDPSVKALDMRQLGIKYIDARDPKQLSERITFMEDWSATFIYENKVSTNGLLDDLFLIQDFEQDISRSKDKTKFCVAKSSADTSCADDHFVSALSAFTDNSLTISDSTSASDALPVLQTAIKSTQWTKKYQTLFDKDLKADSTKVQLMRSTFKIGTPLNGFKSRDDQPEKQKEKVIEFLKSFESEIEAKNKGDGFTIRMYSKALDESVFNEVIQKDILWILGALVFTFVWVFAHTNSLIISLVTMIVLICTMPATIVICIGVFRIKYMSGFHLFTIFIDISVCINNVFVMFDTWFQTAQLCPHIFDNKIERRMAFVLRRSVSGIFMTDLTTAVALFANAWNPIMPLRSISIFAGVIVIVNFFFVLIVLPSTLVMYDKLENKCCKKGPREDEDNIHAYSLDDQYSGIDKFFGEKLNNIFKILVLRWYCFILFLGWTLAAGYLDQMKEFKTYVPEFLPDDHPSVVAKQQYKLNFTGNEDLSRVYFTWGIEDLNKDNTSMWDSYNLGAPIIDRDFDPIDKDTFKMLMDFCFQLQAQDFVYPGSTDCWIQDLNSYAQQKGIAWVPPNKYAAQNYFLQWFKNSQSGTTQKDIDRLGIVDGKITFMQISAKSGVSPQDSLLKKEIEFDKWQEFTKYWQSKLPPTAKSLALASDDVFAFLPTQKSVAQESFWGAYVAGAFCFIVILFTSQNIVISLMCILCLFSIVLSLIAIMVLANWEIGVTEVISLIIGLGLSVNNTIHMAHDYVQAPQLNRQGKIKQALLQKGKTLTSSTFVILLSTCFLFGADITIFQHFAIIVLCCMAISYLMALGFFPAMSHIFGPSSGCGDLCGRLPGQEHEEELEMIRIKQEMQV